MKPCRRVVGFMGGTSCDGLDAALVEIEGDSFLNYNVKYIEGASSRFDALGEELIAFASGRPMVAREIARLSRDLSRAHVELFQKLGVRGVDLVVVHGQTVFHGPPLSWQMLDLPYVAHGCQAPVVGDLRAGDLFYGGQGAPITPMADAILFGCSEHRRNIVNLGGFCNVTRLAVGRSLEGIRGGDVCRCNQWLDALAKSTLGTPCDWGGTEALKGQVNNDVVRKWVAEMQELSRAERSLGTGDERSSFDELALKLCPSDLLASAHRAIAEMIHAYSWDVEEVYLAGGGSKNLALRRALESVFAPTPVRSTSALGIPEDMREAVAMAILGAMCEDRHPITSQRWTDVERDVISGTWVRP